MKCNRAFLVAVVWFILMATVFDIVFAQTVEEDRMGSMLRINEGSVMWMGHGRISTLEIGPPQVEGAIATIHFHNEETHDKWNTGAPIALLWGGVRVEVAVYYNQGPGGSELLSVATPPDITAVPPELLVREAGGDGQIHLFAHTMEGM